MTPEALRSTVYAFDRSFEGEERVTALRHGPLDRSAPHGMLAPERAPD